MYRRPVFIWTENQPIDPPGAVLRLATQPADLATASGVLQTVPGGICVEWTCRGNLHEISLEVPRGARAWEAPARAARRTNLG